MLNRKKNKIHSPLVKLLAVVLYVVIITIIDIYSYGIIYQRKIQKDNYRSAFWSWVFHETKSESHPGEPEVLRYRILQKVIEISGIIVILYFCGAVQAVALLLSHYLLTYDMLFYLVLNPAFLFGKVNNYIDPYWLQHWYQIGFFVLRPYNGIYLFISGFTGLLIVMFSCMPLKKL